MRRRFLQGGSCVAALLVMLGACSSSTDDSQTIGPGPADLGKMCQTFPGAEPEPCSNGLTCMDEEPIGGFVCTKTCDSDADCPGNAACLIFDGNDGHVCARRCNSEAECQALFPGVAVGSSRLCNPLKFPASGNICAGS